MPAAVRYRVEQDDIPRLIANLRRRTPLLVRRTAQQVEALAKARAPVRTGYLKASIQAQVLNPFEAEVTVGARYGFYVEYGTRYMRAQPFLAPAVTRAQAPLADGLRRLLGGGG